MGLWEDAKNIRDKDPAARNVAEVIILYPAFMCWSRTRSHIFCTTTGVSSWPVLSASWRAT